MARGIAASTPYYNEGGGVTGPSVAWDATAASVDSSSLARGFVISDGVNGIPRVRTESRGINTAVVPYIYI